MACKTLPYYTILLFIFENLLFIFENLNTPYKKTKPVFFFIYDLWKYRAYCCSSMNLHMCFVHINIHIIVKLVLEQKCDWCFLVQKQEGNTQFLLQTSIFKNKFSYLHNNFELIRIICSKILFFFMNLIYKI